MRQLSERLGALLALEAGIEYLIMNSVSRGVDRLDENPFSNHEQIITPLRVPVDFLDIGFKLVPVMSFFLTNMLNFICCASLVGATGDIAAFN